MKNQTTHRIVAKLRSLVLISYLMLSVTSAFASHFRYGNITWQRVSGQPNKVKFKITQAWRRTAFPNNQNFVVGSNVSTSLFNPGFGATQVITLKITAMNQVEDWSYGEWSTTITYPTVAANYTAFFTECCRILNLSNNANASMLVATNVQGGVGNDAPVTSIPPFINWPENKTFVSYQIQVVDPNGDALSFSFTPNGQFGSPSVQPTDLAISNSGLLTWSTIGKTKGELYNTSVKVIDSKGAFSMIDFLIRIVGESTPSDFDYTVSPQNGTTFDVQPGDSIAFQIKAGDTDPGDTTKLSVAGLPLGATFTTSGTNPVTGDFGWKPSNGQEGDYVVNITAEDKAGVQNNTVINFNVSFKPRWSSITPGNNSLYALEPGTQTIHSFGSYHPDTNDAVNLSAASGLILGMSFSNTLPTAAANPVNTTLTWTPTYSAWGINKLVIQAQDTFYKEKAFDTVFFLVDSRPEILSTPATTAHVGQPYSYILTASDLDLPYGDSLSLESFTLPSFLTITRNADDTTWTISGTPGKNHIGSHPIAVEVQDKWNHYAGTHWGHAHQDFALFVMDVTPPTVITRNITITLNNGVATIVAADVNNGSFDASGIASMTLSKTSFNTGNLGQNMVTLTVVDSANNSASANAIVTVLQPLNGSIVVNPVNTVNSNHAAYTIYYGYRNSVNLTAVPTGGLPGYTYSWSPTTGVSSPTSVTTKVSPTTTTTYSVTITDANGSTKTVSQTIFVKDVRCYAGNSPLHKVYVCHNGKNTICIDTNALLTHLNEHGDRLGQCGSNKYDNNESIDLFNNNTSNCITAYPNPNNGTFIVKMPALAIDGKLLVRDLMGRIITSVQVDALEFGQSVQVDLSGVAAGTYIVTLHAGEEVHKANVIVQ